MNDDLIMTGEPKELINFLEGYIKNKAANHQNKDEYSLRQVLQVLKLDYGDLPSSDFRESNPKLHKLYVIYAQDTLNMLAEFIEQLEERSRVTCSIIAGLLVQERDRLIKADAAYQEAAWRILGNSRLEKEPRSCCAVTAADEGEENKTVLDALLDGTHPFFTND